MTEKLTRLMQDKVRLTLARELLCDSFGIVNAGAVEEAEFSAIALRLMTFEKEVQKHIDIEMALNNNTN